MGDPHGALKELFFAALDQPRHAREVFLAALDPHVRLEVEALLQAHDDAGSFLEKSPLAEPQPAQTLSAGTKLGPYEIVDLIAKGGMGEVYRARDVRLGRPVAIKVLPQTQAPDRDRQKRFEQEAQAASALNHPNVLIVYDVGMLSDAEGSAFLVMELLDGETLRSRLQSRGRLDAETVIGYALQIARGLCAAHQAGIVHRDLKPENLFVTSDERLKILDFGVAKLDRPNANRTATKTGVLIGTPGYIAPEQVMGHPADARSDIFAFGTVVFEMITGDRPFEGDSGVDAHGSIVYADPFTPRYSPRFSRPGLLVVVRRCLANDPGQRYQSAQEIVQVLEAITKQSPWSRYWHSLGAWLRAMMEWPAGLRPSRPASQLTTRTDHEVLAAIDPKASSAPVLSESHGELVCVAGSLSGQRFSLPGAGFYIGRDAALSHIVIDDSRVSKRHVWVGLQEGRVVAIDQHSMNGTYLNNPENRIAEVTLEGGDTLIVATLEVAQFIFKR